MIKRNVCLICICLTALFLLGCTITGQTFNSFETEVIDCSLNTEIAFLTISDQVQACHDGDSIYLTIDNIGASKIDGLSIMMDADYDLTMNIRKQLDPGETTQTRLNFGSEQMTGIRSIEVQPIIGGLQRIICPGAGISSELTRCAG